MSLSTPSKTPLDKPESITNLEPLSQLNLNQGYPGQKCTKCGKGYPEIEFGGRRDTYGTYYPWSRCKGCHAAINRSRRSAARKLWGPGTNKIRDNKPPVGTLCYCCGKPMTHKGKFAMQFDHDHTTDTFRGWLCKQCNVGIGQLGDDLEGVMRAVKYLSTYETTY